MKQPQSTPYRICWEEPEPGPLRRWRIPRRWIGASILAVSVTGVAAVAAPRVIDALRDVYSTSSTTASVDRVPVAEPKPVMIAETRPASLAPGRSVIGNASTFLVPGSHRASPAPPVPSKVARADQPPGSPLVIDALGPVVHSWSILSTPRDRTPAQDAIEEIVAGPSDPVAEDDDAVLETAVVGEVEKTTVEKAKDSRSTTKVVRSVTLRSKPGGRRIGTIARGTQVYVGECDDWCSIEADGRKGWVYRRYLGKIAPTRT